jgi:membrane-bound lytic murein transglycosylase D
MGSHGGRSPLASATDGGPVRADLPFVPPSDGDPRLHSSGLPLSPPPASVEGEVTSDLSWVTRLDMPDLPVRWDERVVRYVEFFRDDPRGRATFANLYRRSGRVRDMVRRALQKKGLPADLVWVAMIESGFDSTARSASGAAGLWQFMPETARIYGLTMDRWVDQRYSAELATSAAVDFLADLHRRFGSWELALAAYNMGYGGLQGVIRRYNTNDFWSLSRIEGSLPWETTLYVPKILAAAVVTHNLTDFGFADLAVEGPVESEPVDVPPGTPLALVAQAAGCETREIEALNPELRAGHTPPPDGPVAGRSPSARATDGPVAGRSPSARATDDYAVQVPLGKAAGLVRALAKLRRDRPAIDRYVVRFGETLDQIASAHKTTPERLVDLNGMAPGEVLRAGTVLLVPRVEPVPSAGGPRAGGEGVTEPPTPGPAVPKQTVIVPAEVFSYPDRRRVFYRVFVGDTLKEIASAMHVTVDDLRRWNDLDAGARLIEGMTVQAFVPTNADLSRIAVVPESEARVIAVGSEEFLASLGQVRGYRRLAVTVRAGDTLESIGKAYGVGVRTMERINRRGRNGPLRPGETIVVYVPGLLAPLPASGPAAENAPVASGSSSTASVPDLLP